MIQQFDTTIGECYFSKTKGQDLILICNVKLLFVKLMLGIILNV